MCQSHLRHSSFYPVKTPGSLFGEVCMTEVLSLILGGGRGTRLYPLTAMRSKPAVPVAGKYRLIDIPISNCINSGLNKVYVLTQFLSVSLHRHISNTYKFDPFSRGFVEVLAAQQTMEKSDWYQGTADAVRQQIRYVLEDSNRDILILSGDQLYRMDFRKLIQTHRNTQADVTIAVIPVPKEQVESFGVVRIDPSGRVTNFAEKPKKAEEIQAFEVPSEQIKAQGVDPQGRNYLASMGIYLFKREILLELLNADPTATDFGKEIFPSSIKTHKVQTHLFDGYWEDLGTIKAYHDSHMALASENSPFDFHSSEGVIYTRMRFLPASRVIKANLKHALVSDGCLIDEGASLENCVIGVRSHIGNGTVLKNTIIMGVDRYENEEEIATNLAAGIPPLGIGSGSIIHNAIIDKDARIGKNVRITNEAQHENFEESNYVIRDGIVVIPKGAIIHDNSVI